MNGTRELMITLQQPADEKEEEEKMEEKEIINVLKKSAPWQESWNIDYIQLLRLVKLDFDYESLPPITKLEREARKNSLTKGNVFFVDELHNIIDEDDAVKLFRFIIKRISDDEWATLWVMFVQKYVAHTYVRHRTMEKAGLAKEEIAEEEDFYKARKMKARKEEDSKLKERELAIKEKNAIHRKSKEKHKTSFFYEEDVFTLKLEYNMELLKSVEYTPQRLEVSCTPEDVVLPINYTNKWENVIVGARKKLLEDLKVKLKENKIPVSHVSWTVPKLQYSA